MKTNIEANTINLEEYLGKKVKIKISHKIGSKDLNSGFIYPVNCGYTPELVGCDGKKIEAYLLGVFKPVEEYEGRLIGIICSENGRKKIAVAAKPYSKEQIIALIEFQWFHNWLPDGYYYDRPYWPEEFSADTPEVQKAIKLIMGHGFYSDNMIQIELKKSWEYTDKISSWLEDNEIIEKKQKNGTRKLRCSTTKEAMKILKR